MRKIKFTAAVIINYSLVLLACIFYRGGAPLGWAICFWGQIFLTVFNFKVSLKRSELAILGANLLVSTVAANALSTYLYYSNISPDLETILVGRLVTVVSAVFVCIISLIELFIKKETIKPSNNFDGFIIIPTRQGICNLKHIS